MGRIWKGLDADSPSCVNNLFLDFKMITRASEGHVFDVLLFHLFAVSLISILRWLTALIWCIVFFVPLYLISCQP